ncbi:ethionine resistance protein [Coemansia sp. IMI 209127]|nr:ethionine resistance protein [Coemansia sp. IMI 209127]
MPLTHKVREPAARRQQQSSERRSLFIQVGNGGPNILDAAGSNIPFPYSASPCSSPMMTQRTLNTAHPRIPSPFDGHSNIAQYPGARLGRSSTTSAQASSNGPQPLVSAWRHSQPYTAVESNSGVSYFQQQQQQFHSAQNERLMSAPHTRHSLRSAPSSPHPTYPATAVGSWSFEPTPYVHAQPTFQHPPNTAQPLSLSRRRSIVLQSSHSNTLPLSLPPRRTSNAPVPPMGQQVRPFQRPRRLSQPPTANVATSGVLPQSVTSTRSLPHPPQAMGGSDACSLSSASAAQDRRLSVAYERYPPLVSIFESCNKKSAGISCSPEDGIAGAPETPAAGAQMQRASTVSFSSGSPWLQSEARTDQEAPMPISDWLLNDGYCEAAPQQQRQQQQQQLASESRSPATSFSVTTNHSSQGQPEDLPFLQRSPSSTASLSSAFSIASSSSSTSSTPSSYAYIFDSARVSVPEDPLTLKHDRRRTAGGSYFLPIDAAVSRSKSAQNLLLTMADGSSFDNVMPATTTGHAAAAMSAHHEDVAEVRRHSYPSSEAVPNERTPLVGAAASLAQPDERLPTTALVKRESRKILGAAGYLLAGNALQAVISMSQVASSGHLGANELAAIGLAHMVVILTGYPVAFSVLSCLETCASQAFMSAQPVLVGAYFVQAVQILWIFGLVLGSLWFSSQPLLVYIMHGASPETVAAAVSYLRWYFVPFMVFATMLCSRQVLYAQGITYPLPYLTLLGALVTVGAQYLLVFSPHMQLGIRGVALGSGAGYLAMLLATLLVIRKHNVAHIWGGMRVRAPWRPFIKLLPACILLSLLSTGTSELITMAATQLGTSSLTAQSVVSALSRMFMIVFSSIGVAALNRSGNLIGQQAARRAKISAHASLYIGILCAIAGCVAMLWAPEFWIRLFTSDAQVVSDIMAIMPIAALAFAAQSIAFVCSQLLSAQGRQSLAARIKFGALYIVGVPLGYYWAIVCAHGLWGLWAAVAVGQLCTAAVEILVVLRTNWSLLVRFCAETIVHGNAYSSRS